MVEGWLCLEVPDTRACDGLGDADGEERAGVSTCRQARRRAERSPAGATVVRPTARDPENEHEKALLGCSRARLVDPVGGVDAMRKRGLLLLLIASQVLLAGCSGAPASSDRKSTEASPTPSAGASTPTVGSCYDGNAIERYRSEMRAIAKVDTCDVKHVAETAYVGTLNGAAPPAGADLRAIWSE